MGGRKLSRHRRPGLLARPPDSDSESRFSSLLVDPIEQLEQLRNLYAQGVLSQEEFESQKARLVGS